jgi:CRISPR/Cas system-associated endonuclease Cas1
MEPLRPVVDSMVLEFVREHTFAPADFELTERGGVCRLHPQMTRRFVESVEIQRTSETPVNALLDALTVS